jgi:outer membrane protein OmpA-like peptidoglycan-associated protein
MNERRGGGAKWLVLLALVGAGLYLVSWVATGEFTNTASDVTPTVQGDSEQSPSTTGAATSSETTPPTTVPPTTAAPAADTTDAPPSTTATLTIAQEIAATGDLTTIDAFLAATDLDDMLDGAGSYTVFAPSNTGFAEMDTDLRNAISADQDRVRSVTLNHLVEGDVPSLRALDTRLMTMAGTELIFEEIDDELFIVTDSGRVGVQENRIVAANGVVHVVDGVLLGDEASGVQPVPDEADAEPPVEDAAPVEEPIDEEPVEEPVPEPEDPPSEPNETVDAIAEILEVEPVQFDDSSADITAESLVSLDRVVEILEADEATRLEVAGHTDDIGPADGNQRWSERRARSVRDYLVSQGIDPERLVAAGYGENRPIADNNTEEGRAQNRRIEFTLL